MNETERKKNCVAGVVLGIVGMVFSLFVPAVTYACSVTGLALSIKRRKTHRSSAAIALNIVAISIAAINSICGIIMTIKMYRSENNNGGSARSKETEE